MTTTSTTSTSDAGSPILWNATLPDVDNPPPEITGVFIIPPQPPPRLLSFDAAQQAEGFTIKIHDAKSNEDVDVDLSGRSSSGDPKADWLLDLEFRMRALEERNHDNDKMMRETMQAQKMRREERILKFRASGGKWCE